MNWDPYTIGILKFDPKVIQCPTNVVQTCVSLIFPKQLTTVCRTRFSDGVFMVLIKYIVGQINEMLTNMHKILYEIFCLLACKWSNVSMCSNMQYLLSYNLIVKLSITCPHQVWERLSLSDNNNTLFLYKRLMLSKPVIKIYTQSPPKGLYFYLTYLHAQLTPC